MRKHTEDYRFTADVSVSLLCLSLIPPLFRSVREYSLLSYLQLCLLTAVIFTGPSSLLETKVCRNFLFILNISTQSSLIGMRDFAKWCLAQYKLLGIEYFECLLRDYVRNSPLHHKEIFACIFSSSDIPLWFSALQLYVQCHFSAVSNIC